MIYRGPDRFIAEIHASALGRHRVDAVDGVGVKRICALGDAAAWPIQGLIKNFRDEIEDRIKTARIAAE